MSLFDLTGKVAIITGAAQGMGAVEARRFAEAIKKEYPDQILSYNCSPSFNWKKNLDDATIAKFQRELSAMGYKLYRKRYTGIYHELRELVRASRAWSAQQREAYQAEQLHDLIRYCRTNSVPLIGMSRAAESTLGRGSDVLLTLPTVAEACPNGLAPTSSTTMALALGDALTIVLMARRGFSREEFGFRHPGGKLGRSLQTAGDYVASRTDDIPSVGETAAVEDVILAISEGRKGCVAVLDATGVIAGMVTDGDLRRAMLAGKLTGNAAAIMTPSPRTISLDERMSAVIKRLTEHRISNAFVVQDGRPVGIVDMKDLLAEGYV